VSTAKCFRYIYIYIFIKTIFPRAREPDTQVLSPTPIRTWVSGGCRLTVRPTKICDFGQTRIPRPQTPPQNAPDPPPNGRTEIVKCGCMYELAGRHGTRRRRYANPAPHGPKGSPTQAPRVAVRTPHSPPQCPYMCSFIGVRQPAAWSLTFFLRFCPGAERPWHGWGELVKCGCMYELGPRQPLKSGGIRTRPRAIGGVPGGFLGPGHKPLPANRLNAVLGLGGSP
jgi:hypothetical protein